MISGTDAAPSVVTMIGAMPVTRMVPARPMTNAPHQFVSLARPPPAYSSSSMGAACAPGCSAMDSSSSSLDRDTKCGTTQTPPHSQGSTGLRNGAARKCVGDPHCERAKRGRRAHCPPESTADISASGSLWLPRAASRARSLSATGGDRMTALDQVAMNGSTTFSPPSTAEEARVCIRANGIEFLFAQFVDMHGKPNAKLVPASHLDGLLSD